MQLNPAVSQKAIYNLWLFETESKSVNNQLAGADWVLMAHRTSHLKTI